MGIEVNSKKKKKLAKKTSVGDGVESECKNPRAEMRWIQFGAGVARRRVEWFGLRHSSR